MPGTPFNSHLLETKRRFIKDPVWGHIEIFAWERELLNHELVNRLNGVVQNSCAFKVYPSMKYSRYAHSIGAMHVITEMYVNVVRNTLGVSEVQPESGAVRQLKAETTWVNAQFDGLVVKQTYFEAVKDAVVGSFAISRDHALPLTVLRLCAMLHDIGHLPYSHLFEHALGNFVLGSESEASSTSGSKRRNLKQKAAETSRKNLISELEKGRNDIGPKAKIHEILDYRLAQMLATDPLAETGDEKDTAHGVNKTFLRAVILAARDIWAGRAHVAGAQGETTQILSSLVSDVIDADRIDFVRRDSLFSGLFHCSVDFDRLFDLYGVSEVHGTNGDPMKYAALPSRRTTSDAEKLLIERFQLYKYHRVHRFDELL